MAVRPPPHEVVVMGVKVHFPFQPYGAQISMMHRIVRALSQSKNALLESPTGSGKSLALLCAALAWQEHMITEGQKESGFLAKGTKASVPKIFFASRTHSQIKQLSKELRLTRYRPQMTVLASRSQLCVNASVRKSESVNDSCKELVKGNQCTAYHQADKLISDLNTDPPTIFDIEDLERMGKKRTSCAYYASRKMMVDARIVFCPYNYLLDPSIRDAMQINLSNNVVIIDEGHNCEDVCRDAASGSFTLRSFEELCTNVGGFLKLGNCPFSKEKLRFLLQRLNKLATWTKEMMELLVDRLTNNARDRDKFHKWGGQEFRGILADECDITAENHGEFCEYLKELLPKPDSSRGSGGGAQAHYEDESEDALTQGGSTRRNPSELSPFAEIVVRDILIVFKYFFEHSNDYRIVIAPDSRDDKMLVMNFWCFSPAVAFEPFAKQCRSVVLTSGTLSPMDSFESELGADFPIKLEAPHVIDKYQLYATVVNSSDNGISLEGTWKNRQKLQYQDALGKALLQIVKSVPDGVLCFFPSYGMMQTLLKRWGCRPQAQFASSAAKIFSEIEKEKKVFQEDRRDPQTIDKFKKAARASSFASSSSSSKRKNKNKTKGAILFAVFRGKVSEGIDFKDHQARAVVLVGIPYPSQYDPQVQLKKAYNDRKLQEQKVNQSKYKMPRGKDVCVMKAPRISGDDWYSQQAFRAVNQAVGRCIRHRHDYGSIIFLDPRFGSRTKRLSKWIRPSMYACRDVSECSANLRSFFAMLKKNPPQARSNVKSEAAAALAAVKAEGGVVAKKENIAPPPNVGQPQTPLAVGKLPEAEHAPELNSFAYSSPLLKKASIGSANRARNQLVIKYESSSGSGAAAGASSSSSSSAAAAAVRPDVKSSRHFPASASKSSAPPRSAASGGQRRKSSTVTLGGWLGKKRKLEEAPVIESSNSVAHAVSTATSSGQALALHPPRSFPPTSGRHLSMPPPLEKVVSPARPSSKSNAVSRTPSTTASHDATSSDAISGISSDGTSSNDTSRVSNEPERVFCRGCDVFVGTASAALDAASSPSVAVSDGIVGFYDDALDVRNHLEMFSKLENSDRSRDISAEQPSSGSSAPIEGDHACAPMGISDEKMLSGGGARLAVFNDKDGMCYVATRCKTCKSLLGAKVVAACRQARIPLVGRVWLDRGRVSQAQNSRYVNAFRSAAFSSSDAKTPTNVPTTDATPEKAGSDSASSGSAMELVTPEKNSRPFVSAAVVKSEREVGSSGSSNCTRAPVPAQSPVGIAAAVSSNSSQYPMSSASSASAPNPFFSSARLAMATKRPFVRTSHPSKSSKGFVPPRQASTSSTSGNSRALPAGRQGSMFTPKKGATIHRHSHTTPARSSASPSASASASPARAAHRTFPMQHPNNFSRPKSTTKFSYPPPVSNNTPSPASSSSSNPSAFASPVRPPSALAASPRTPSVASISTPSPPSASARNSSTLPSGPSGGVSSKRRRLLMGNSAIHKNPFTRAHRTGGATYVSPSAYSGSETTSTTSEDKGAASMVSNNGVTNPSSVGTSAFSTGVTHPQSPVEGSRQRSSSSARPPGAPDVGRPSPAEMPTPGSSARPSAADAGSESSVAANASSAAGSIAANANVSAAVGSTGTGSTPQVAPIFASQAQVQTSGALSQKRKLKRRKTASFV